MFILNKAIEAATQLRSPTKTFTKVFSQSSVSENDAFLTRLLHISRGDCFSEHGFFSSHLETSYPPKPSGFTYLV